MKTIAIGLVALVLAHGGASAQTADETARILRDFQQRVSDYAQQHMRLALFPEAINAATPAPRIFTPPVALVFRQLIARTVAPQAGAAAMSGVSAWPHPTVMEPFPATALQDFPAMLRDSLPALPAPLEYRLIGHDLVVRDTEADVIVGVLRDAVGRHLTGIR